jgi:hypothetical protein
MRRRILRWPYTELLILALLVAVTSVWLYTGPPVRIGTFKVTKVDFAPSSDDIPRTLTNAQADEVVSALKQSHAYRLGVQPPVYQGAVRIFHEDGSIDIVYIGGDTVARKEGDRTFYELPMPFSQFIHSEKNQGPAQ